MTAKMTIPKRTKVGCLLVIISVIAFVAFMVFSALHTDWHYDGGGVSGSSDWVAFSGESSVSGYYLIPILLCGLIGVVCLVWPSRKPPKLNP